MKITKSKLREIIREEIQQLRESSLEKFLDDLGKEGIEGWGTKGENRVVLPKGHPKFDKRKVDKLAKKHGFDNVVKDDGDYLTLDK